MARTKSKRKSDDDDAAVVKPRSKKRVQVGDTPPEAAPRKQRKSAAASLVKLKEIAAAEEELTDASEEDLTDVDEATADLPVGPDASTLESHDLQISEEANVAPGFRLWESSGIKSLAKSGETLAIAKVRIITTSVSLHPADQARSTRQSQTTLALWTFTIQNTSLLYQ